MVGSVIVQCELLLTSILNFSKTFKNSLAHLHIVENVIVQFEIGVDLWRPFWILVPQKNWSRPLAAILNFGSIFK